MRLLGKPKLVKLKKKKGGDYKLAKAIDKLIDDLEGFTGDDFMELKKLRGDIDKVHNDGFFFFDISVHRAMVLVEFIEQEATIVWADSHDVYERLFQNDKNVIETWLRNRGYID